MPGCDSLVRRTAVVVATSVSLTGCIGDALRLPWDESVEPLPAPSLAPDVHDPANDPAMAFARFGFILVAIGGLAGIVALQAKLQKDKNPRDADSRQEDIGWPVAAFGLGVGLPLYVISTVLAEQRLQEAQRQDLSGPP
jgi:hypothetical protein